VLSEAARTGAVTMAFFTCVIVIVVVLSRYA